MNLKEKGKKWGEEASLGSLAVENNLFLIHYSPWQMNFFFPLKARCIDFLPACGASCLGRFFLKRWISHAGGDCFPRGLLQLLFLQEALLVICDRIW